jgi:hypothetical protein
MTSLPESEGLTAFEQGIDQHPDALRQFIASWEGFDWFWQLIVFVTYSERTDIAERLEGALSRLAASATPESNAELADQLLSKVQTIYEFTKEDLLHQEVQRLALILVPTQQGRTI